MHLCKLFWDFYFHILGSIFHLYDNDGDDSVFYNCCDNYDYSYFVPFPRGYLFIKKKTHFKMRFVFWCSKRYCDKYRKEVHHICIYVSTSYRGYLFIKKKTHQKVRLSFDAARDIVIIVEKEIHHICIYVSTSYRGYLFINIKFVEKIL